MKRVLKIEKVLQKENHSNSLKMAVLGKCHEDINACAALKNVIDMQHLSVISSVQMDISSMQMEKKKQQQKSKTIMLFVLSIVNYKQKMDLLRIM